MEAILKTFPNGLGIWEQIVEVDFDRPTFDCSAIQAERQG
jgi:hypothetical protein